MLNRRWIGTAVVAVLAALPVNGLVCALLCQPVAGVVPAAERHMATAGCHEAAPDAPEIRGVSPHDCGRHDDGVLATVSLTPPRASADVSLDSRAGEPVSIAPAALAVIRVQHGSGPPPGVIAARPLLVLRI